MQPCWTLLVSLCLVIFFAGCGEASVENTPQPQPTPAPTVAQAIIATPSPVSAQPARDILPAVDAFLNQRVEQQQFSGAVLIAQDGVILVSKGYGLADRVQQIPNTPQTKFRLGSLTKQFTALAILQLQAQGKLNVQALVCQYLPNCPSAWQAITLHHLLTHTAGLPDLTRFPDYERTKTTPSTPFQTMDRFKDKPLDFPPGTKWDYSNSNYIVLGVVIEQVSGQTYAAFVQKNIFAPLQMTNSGYEHDKSILAKGYANANAEAEPIDMSIPFAAGGLYSTVEDLYRWDQALYTEKLLPRTLLDLLFTPFAEIPDSGGLHYGYGWIIGQQFNHPIVNHNGGIEGFVSSINRFPTDKAVVILLSNQQDVNPNEISSQLTQILFK